MAFIVVTYEGEHRYGDTASFTIAEASGVLSVVDENGVAARYSPRAWYRVTDSR